MITSICQGCKISINDWHRNMHISVGTFFDVRSFTCAFLSNLWLSLRVGQLLGACQHTTTASSNGGSNIAAVEASQTIINDHSKDAGCQHSKYSDIDRGWAWVTSSQPGRSESQKRLMAIRSARSAMRDLAEQIHGLQVGLNTTVIDLVAERHIAVLLTEQFGGRAPCGLIQPVLIPMKSYWKSTVKPLGYLLQQRGKRCSER